MAAASVFNMPCFAHFFSTVGEKLSFTVVTKFLLQLCALMSLSYAARQFWIDLAGSAFPSYSETRWCVMIHSMGCA